mgnify:FL=1
MSITVDDPKEAARQWFELLGRFCAAVDYDAGETIFADDVVAFGTRTDVVQGLAPLRRNQWEGIWGNIADFRINMDSIHAGGAADQAWGVATWTSTGFHENGETFDRPGRCTVILEQRDGHWLAVHTHFSLFPGTPPRTFGPKNKA